MSSRKVILATGEIYHVFNHSVQGIPIFRGEREGRIFLESMKFYLQSKPPTKFSIYRTSRNRFPIDLADKLATIIAYCLMPNHFHLIIRQEKDKGIKRFMQRTSNSFAHYFSIKYKNRGPVFESSFKAIRIETDEQLVHLSRYIHLNPATAYLVEDPKEYSFSSYKIYLGEEQSEIINPSIVLNQFSSSKKYKRFVLDQKNYQRKLDLIKYLLLE